MRAPRGGPRSTSRHFFASTSQCASFSVGCLHSPSAHTHVFALPSLTGRLRLAPVDPTGNPLDPSGAYTDGRGTEPHWQNTPLEPRTSLPTRPDDRLHEAQSPPIPPHIRTSRLPSPTGAYSSTIKRPLCPPVQYITIERVNVSNQLLADMRRTRPFN